MGSYRVTHLLANLDWVDFDLGCSPGWWAATVATYCQSRPGELNQIKVNPTEVRQQMCHPVDSCMSEL